MIFDGKRVLARQASAASLQHQQQAALMGGGHPTEAGPHPPHVGGGSPGPAPERHAGKVLGAKRRSSGGVRVDEGGVAVPGLAVPGLGVAAR